MNSVCAISVIVALAVLAAFAKSESPITMLWTPEKPALKLIFDKFRQPGSYAGQNTYVSDVTLQNLTDKQIPRAVFTVYFLDENKVRIGRGTLQVADLDARQAARMQFQFNSVGVPASLARSANKDMLGAKTIPLRVVSVPEGASLKADGLDSGTTPVMVRMTVGRHQLARTKEGYAPGNTPVDVTAEELPGGSITVELGGLSRDTVELRDGSVVLGDVLAMSMAEVVVRTDGKKQRFPRNQVKKMMPVEPVMQERPAILQPAQAVQPK